MKEYKNRILYYVLCIILISCSTEVKKDKKTDELKIKFQEQLLNWKLNNSVSISKEEKILNVSVLYKGTDINSFFLDKESNSMIISMLGYSLFEELELYDTINYQIKFEGYPDIFNIPFPKIKLTENKHNFDNVPIFYSFVEYSFIHLGYIDVLKSTQYISYLHTNFGDIFNFNGSYWDLLYDYSKACKKPEENLKSVFHFIWFASVIKSPENPKSDDINQDVFKYFLNACGFDESLLEKNTLEIMNYLDENYN